MSIALAGAAASSCVGPAAQSTPQGAVQLQSYNIPCDDAHRYAARSLKLRGYRITDVERGASGGSVAGRKESGETASIRVTCGGGGVTVNPSGGLWQDQGMRFTFNQLVEFGDKVWPPPTSPQVRMELISGPESKLEFPQEIEQVGMVAVKVVVFNGGARTVRVDPRRIRARTGSGAGAAALGESGVKERLGSADPAIGERLLRPAKLKKGDEARGFVFFPAGSYTSAVLVMVDDQTNEADEFEVSLVGR
jgi:hypothetical protein